MEIKKLPVEYWPEGLHEIPQPPKELYILGDFPDEDLTFLCVVGSRKFTTYGKDVCEKLITGLRGYPVAIVSGLAMGIDAIAHKKALEVGLKTLVFPGSGLSKEAMYPKTNAILAEDIVKKGGCLISEFEPNFKATLWSFGKRNRLMAGISKAVLIIEAAEKSGTLITARLATEYNKDVLAVPGSIFSPNAKGTNMLLRLGATPITCVEDLLDALGFKQETDSEKQQKLFADLSPEEMKVVDILSEPMPRDELIRELDMSVADANTLLTVMEIKKLIKEEIGEIRLY
ncbi:MAG: DNA-processing protein DprA [Candidatus Pacebacteria bacterium]|nr:DNA-processing protein DprA [Candidatus Paceibacterota bacterium]MBP9851293.1 DNA-processing protein DprA [Candidatus Paceibacterota bacterium]